MLAIETRPVDRLIPYVRNARTHSDEQIAQIAASIAEFGFVNPVLIGADDVVIAGHGRLLAARRLGLAEVPVIVLDHLTEAQRPIGGAPMPIDLAKANATASFRDQDKLNAIQAQKRKGNAAPGGSPLPAADYSKSKVRGDGRGRPMGDG